MASACTIIARNYLHHARILAESLVAHNRGSDFTVLLIDDEEGVVDDRAEAFKCRRLSEIGLSTTEIAQLAGIYEVTELATAVKPPFLRSLLSEGRDHILYLDPDIKIFDSLSDAAVLSREHGIVLTPHMTSPLPKDGLRVNDAHILSSGIYNLGFIGLGAGTDRFVDWWWSKTRRDALVDPDRMMFTDQRWVDYVPSFFEHHILKHPGYNVAYWNLHERDLTWTGDRYLVAGQPLVFFHFSGFSREAPHLLSKHQADRPRILLSDRPALRRICAEYHADLDRAESGQPAHPYGWATLPSGLLFDRRMRRLYRGGLEASERGRAKEPPPPFDRESDFIAWLNQPVAAGLHPRVSRYLFSIYQDRPDLRAAFPNLEGEDCSRYFMWLHGDGVAQEKIPPLLLPSVTEAVRSGGGAFAPASPLQEGVNIAGYFRAELGIGEAARLLRHAAEFAGIPCSTIDYGATESRKQHRFDPGGNGRAPYDVNVVCVTGDRTPDFASDMGTGFFRGRHTVGYWFWELEQFPASMHSGFDVVDEVWAATRFIAEAIDRVGRRPVHHVPLAVPMARRAPNITRDTLRLPAGFLFVFAFDFFSTLERKNPLGLVRAFRQAFDPGEGPTLVLKSINGGRCLSDLERLRAAAADRPDILVIDEYYTAEQKNAFLALCDCYVSLHRSEGLGLTMAEAMAFARPVIATAYSGNVDFMTPENSYLVDYVIGSVPAGSHPYPAGASWAEPRLDHAAELMRRVYEARDEAHAKATRARQDIATRHGLRTSAEALTRRLDAIRQSRRLMVAEPPAATPPPPAVLRPSPAVDPPAATPASLTDRLRSMSTQTLFRAVRLYRRQQRGRAWLSEGLREVQAVAAKAATLESQQRQALEAVWNTLHAVEVTQREQQAVIERAGAAARQAQVDAGEQRVQLQSHHQRAFDEVTAALKALEAIQREQHAAVEALVTAVREDASGTRKAHQAVQEFAESLETQLASTSRALDALDQGTARQLRTLRDRLDVVADASTALADRLYAAPYMAEPGRFHLVNNQGRRVLGFRSNGSDGRNGYRGFEDIFRGPEPFIRDRQRVYVPLLQASEPIVDIGCGRGELLDLLKEAGARAIGVDANAGMVAHARAKGHLVEQLDGLVYLKGQPDGSLGAIFSAQVVEHLAYDDLMLFLKLSCSKLRPGGRLIFETVNPHAIEALKTFWTDLTHVRPIFPEVALAWCWLVGFERAEVMFPNGGGDLETDRRTQGEYGVIAIR